MTTIRTIYVCYYNELLRSSPDLAEIGLFSDLMGRAPTMQSKDLSSWANSDPVVSAWSLPPRRMQVLSPEHTKDCVDPKFLLHRPVRYPTLNGVSDLLAFKTALQWDPDEDIARLFVLRLHDASTSVVSKLLCPVQPTVTVYQKLWDSGDDLNAVEMATLAFVSKTLLTSPAPFKNPVHMTMVVYPEGESLQRVSFWLPNSPQEAQALGYTRVNRMFL